jgi:hypothetical protein
MVLQVGSIREHLLQTRLVGKRHHGAVCADDGFVRHA